MAPAPFVVLGVLAMGVMAGGASLLWYRRKVRRQQRQSSWRELCLRLELAPQPGEARVAMGELREASFLLHDTGSDWLVELPLAQPLLPPGMLLLSPDAPTLPPHLELRPLAWEGASVPPRVWAWSVEGQELSGKAEAPAPFLEEAARALQAHAPLRVEPRRLIQALRVGALLSVKEAREAVRTLDATARGWLEVAERHGLPRVQPLPPPLPAVERPAPQEVQPVAQPPPLVEPPAPEVRPARKRGRELRKRGVKRDGDPHEVVVDFNALPRLTRERFVASTGPRPEVAPLLAELNFRGGILWTGAVTVVGLVLLCVFGWMLVLPLGTGLNQGALFIVHYALAVFLILATAIFLLFRGKWRRTLPFHPGRYVFRSGFVDATARELRITPLSELTDIQLKHHYDSGQYTPRYYTHTLLSLRFRDRQGVEEFSLCGEAESELLRSHLWAVSRGGRIKGHEDPFFEVLHQPGGLWALRDLVPEEDPGGGPRVQELPRGSQPAFLFGRALLVSLMLAPCIWWGNNHLHDEAVFEAAKRDSSGRALKRYADDGGRHAQEALELGLARSFQDCEKQDSEECWREFPARWPSSPWNEEILRERLPRAALKAAPRTVAGLTQFLGRYPDSVVSAQVREQLLPAAEYRELPSPSIITLRHFRRKYPRSEAGAQAEARIHELLAAAQAALQSQASPQNPQVARFMSRLLTYMETSDSSLVLVGFRRQAVPSLQSAGLDASSTERLEGQTVKALGNAFRQLFPEGVLTLVHGEPPPERTQDTGVTRPRIDIHYTVSGSLPFDFDVALRLPGEQPVRLRIPVKPPKGSGPRVQRAFEELRGKLGAVFFRADSKAFQALHQKAP